MMEDSHELLYKKITGCELACNLTMIRFFVVYSQIDWLLFDLDMIMHEQNWNNTYWQIVIWLA